MSKKASPQNWPRTAPVEETSIAARRRALGALSGLGALTLFADAAKAASPISDDESIDTFTEDRLQQALARAGTCAVIPAEIAGPYPLSTILSNPKTTRKNVIEDRTGVPLTLRIKVENTKKSCRPLVNAAVYIWHCDKDGLYSGYDVSGNEGQTGKTYLRGIQVSNDKGHVTFKTIYPGWYAGRATHIHLQVFLSDDTGSTAVATTQLAFPAADTSAVYASPLYQARGQNTTSNEDDGSFSDGYATQLLAISGSVTAGYVGAITIGVNPKSNAG